MPSEGHTDALVHGLYRATPVAVVFALMMGGVDIAEAQFGLFGLVATLPIALTWTVLLDNWWNAKLLKIRGE